MVKAIAVSLTLVIMTVLIHYEGLRILSRGLQLAISIPSRSKMVLVILSIFLIHIAEISVYGLGFWFAENVVHLGSFEGARVVRASDYFYFSAEAFSTLGLGDIYPVGNLRMLASMETLNGLLLIGWSTSFTFLGMQHYWDNGTSKTT